MDKTERRLARWFSCALTGAPLVAPVVCCRGGLLYNKEAVLQALLHKTIPAELSHIRGLGDVFTVNFTSNPEYRLPATAPVNPDPVSPWVCAVSNREMGKSHDRFVANPACGCVFSVDLPQQSPAEVACFKCGGSMTERLVEINPSDELWHELKAALDAAPRKSRKAKKDKKDKKSKGSKRADSDGGDVRARKRGKVDAKSVEAKLSEAAAHKAQQRITSSHAVSSLFSTSGSKVVH